MAQYVHVVVWDVRYEGQEILGVGSSPKAGKKIADDYLKQRQERGTIRDNPGEWTFDREQHTWTRVVSRDDVDLRVIRMQVTS